jgi:hypothetical protein
VDQKRSDEYFKQEFLDKVGNDYQWEWDQDIFYLPEEPSS